MRFGRSVPEGWLPAFSVGSEREASFLLTLACPTNIDGEFVAVELGIDQTIDNLLAFGERLKRAHEKYVEGGTYCDCRLRKTA